MKSAAAGGVRRDAAVHFSDGGDNSGVDPDVPPSAWGHRQTDSSWRARRIPVSQIQPVLLAR